MTIRSIVAGFWLLVALVLTPSALRVWGALPIGPAARLALHGVQIALVGWAWLTLRCTRSWIVSLNLLGIVSGGLLVATEALLQNAPTILGQEFANGLHSKYHSGRGGIYYDDPGTRMRFMYPNHQTTMTYNGYTWRHQTDADGFRNPTTRVRADIVLLGDSYLYGHGIDIADTVGVRLEALTGRPVASLARQGDDALSAAYLLTEHIGRLRPRVVVYCFYSNDLRDPFNRYTRAELAAFAATPIDQIRFPSRSPMTDAIRAHRAWLAGKGFAEALRERLALLRIPAWLRARREQAAWHAAYDATGDDLNLESVPWRATRTAIRYMARLSQDAGARWFLAPITPWTPEHAGMLRTWAEREGMTVVDTTTMMAEPRGPNFLPGDGHFSPRGAQEFARLLAVAIGTVEDR